MSSPHRFLLALTLALTFQGSVLTDSPLAGQTPDSVALVRGRVLVHETGEPLWGAAVSLASGPEGTQGIGTRVTGEGGGFLFRNVPPGVYRLSVTLLGYSAFRDTLRVAPSAALDLQLPLSTSPVPLEPIVVVARRQQSLAMRRFEARRMRLGGTFFDREEIEARGPIVFTDLMRVVPGARVVPVGQFGNGVLFRGSCRPAIWMDGMRLLPTEDLDALLIPSDLEAVEVYSGASLPAEFGPSPCGAILVWTRHGEPTPNRGSFWRQVLAATVLVAAAVLFTR